MEELDAFISILVQELQVVDLPGGGPPECNSGYEQSVLVEWTFPSLFHPNKSQQIIGRSSLKHILDHFGNNDLVFSQLGEEHRVLKCS